MTPMRRPPISPAPFGARPQRGFTLIEVLVATATAAILGAVLIAMILGVARTTQRAETTRRLAILREGLAAFYRTNAFLVEADEGPSFSTGPRSRIGNGTILSDADVQPLLGYLARYAPSDAYRDGYGQPMKLFVSTRRFQLVDGISLAYRRLAIVSAGPNGRFESADWDPVQAQLARGGDDEVVILDALADQAELFRRTDQRMQRLADAVRGYAQGRFLLDPNRDPLIDYFGRSADAPGGSSTAASDRFDPGSALARTSTKADASMTDAELAALQLTRDDALGAWGQPLRYENDTETVRNPQRAAPDNFPPYTARVVVALPGRGDYQQLIIGAF